MELFSWDEEVGTLANLTYMDPDDDKGEVVDADQHSTSEAEQLAKGLADVRQGSDDLHTEKLEEKVVELLMGLTDQEGPLVEALKEDAEYHRGKGIKELEKGLDELQEAKRIQREAEVNRLALTVVNHTQAVASWQGAVKRITTVLKNDLTDEQLVQAVGGDVAQARQRRLDLVALGEKITRSLSHTIDSIEQAIPVVERTVEFVGGLLAIYDHLPMPIQQVIGDALKVLLAFKL